MTMAKHTCPVCGQYQFEAWNDMDICEVCDWCNDGVQESKPDYCGGANHMSLNQNGGGRFDHGETHLSRVRTVSI